MHLGCDLELKRAFKGPIQLLQGFVSGLIMYILQFFLLVCEAYWVTVTKLINQHYLYCMIDESSILISDPLFFLDTGLDVYSQKK